MTALRVAAVRAEYRVDSEWVADPAPRLTWCTETALRDWEQERAEIELDRDGRLDTYVVEGDESLFVDWPGAPLTPGASATVRVRVEGGGSASPWSEPLVVRAAFLDSWDAPFLALPDPATGAAPFLARGELSLERPVRSAVLHATALGMCRVTINGRRVDDAELTPGWTSYPQRLLHESADVTSLVRQGLNAIGAEVAGGWFAESYGFGGADRRVYGDQAAFAAVLLVEFDDGGELRMSTSDAWRVTGDGARLSSSIYLGEHYDARRELPGWDEPGFDDADWSEPLLVEREIAPVPRSSPPVRVIEELPVASVVSAESGRLLLDFGQNLVGRLRVSLEGDAGDRFVLRHAEVLEDGELGTRPLRRAVATDSYVCRGGGVERWEPAFTFHGFRYAEVSGPRTPDPAGIRAVVLHSDLERTGRFTTSHPELDRLHRNVVWSMRGNFVSIPTDCPQRDERMGWTGDIQVFAPTASSLYDCDGFLASWLTDLALEQSAAGGVPFVVPDVLDSGRFAAAAWGDAATVVPTVLAERFGDRRAIARQFASMRAWVDRVLADEGRALPWEGRFQFGDWLDPTAPADRPWAGRTDADLVAGAYLFRSARLVADAAELLGAADGERYRRIADDVRRAWLAEYLTPAGRLVSDSPTAYCLALEFGLADEPDVRARLGERLLELVRRDGYRIGTGFVGTPLVLDALSGAGAVAAAGRMLLETELPSWLYPVRLGATTIWERWDSMLPDGRINPGDMTSFNHYAFGAVADWLHRVLAGLSPQSAGYRRVRIAPHPIAEVEAAAFELHTPFGRALVDWRIAEGRLETIAVVPPNVRATVELPGNDPFEVGSGEHRWVVDDPRPRRRTIGPAAPWGTVLDDAPTLRAVLEAARRVEPGFDPLARGPVPLDRRLGDSFFAPSREVLEAIEAALSALAPHEVR